MFEKIYHGNTFGTLNDIYATDPNTGKDLLLAELNGDLGIYVGFNTVAAFQQRLIASYNALAGHDPAKLKGLVEAVKLAAVTKDYTADGRVEISPAAWDAVMDALAAFQGGGTDGDI